MISAKKSLGQNFINDRTIIEKILNIVDIKNKKILEIGPGTGNLTSRLLNKLPKKLIAIEKDKRLVEFLQKNYGTRIKLIEGDVLKIDTRSGEYIERVKS